MSRNDANSDVIAAVLELKHDLLGTQHSDTILRADRVREWMNSDDVEIVGAAYDLLTTPGIESHVNPPLSIEEVSRFFLEYYGRCIRENPDGEWSDSRYSAARDFGNLFKVWWHDATTPRWVLDDMRHWLRALYIEGGEEIRTCIRAASLGPLLEDRQIAPAFDDWKTDPVLAEAIRQIGR
jgi:hypothetical protein